MLRTVQGRQGFPEKAYTSLDPISFVRVQPEMYAHHKRAGNEPLDGLTGCFRLSVAAFVAATLPLRFTSTLRFSIAAANTTPLSFDVSSIRNRPASALGWWE